ncbi:MAG TPA: carboxymuconolactone decarboxylase family protein [Burkholderiales bacterium]|jgi:4-carboxymuconolactone decarboxylase|nr:carboxymuconolactone decarboxylase family protein [Burkholderiales bacterium]
MSRLPVIEPAKLSADQRQVYDTIAAGPRAGVRGPFLALMHVPELAHRIQHLGEYLRYKTLFPPRLSELAILITARHYTCQYEWHAHESHAQKGGLAQSIIDAIKEKHRPNAMQPDEAAVYDFATELLRNGKVPDTVYEAVVQAFGTRGAIELGALIGYYIMIAMTLLAHEVALPPDKALPLRE